MTIAEIIEKLTELARRSNLTFDELMEWISRNDRENKKTPWEE